MAVGAHRIPPARAWAEGQRRRPLFQSSKNPSKVHEVALATEPECRESAESVLEMAPLKTHRREVRVLEKRAFESYTAKEVNEIGECRFAHLGNASGLGSRLETIRPAPWADERSLLANWICVAIFTARMIAR